MRQDAHLRKQSRPRILASPEAARAWAITGPDLRSHSKDAAPRALNAHGIEADRVGDSLEHDAHPESAGGQCRPADGGLVPPRAGQADGASDGLVRADAKRLDGRQAWMRAAREHDDALHVLELEPDDAARPVDGDVARARVPDGIVESGGAVDSVRRLA